jgi:hypothetical protein
LRKSGKTKPCLEHHPKGFQQFSVEREGMKKTYKSFPATADF